MKGVGRPRACTGLPFPASRVSDIEQAQERHPAAHPVVGPQRTCASAASEIQAKPRHSDPQGVLCGQDAFLRDVWGGGGAPAGTQSIITKFVEWPVVESVPARVDTL